MEPIVWKRYAYYEHAGSTNKDYIDYQLLWDDLMTMLRDVRAAPVPTERELDSLAYAADVVALQQAVDLARAEWERRLRSNESSESVREARRALERAEQLLPRPERAQQLERWKAYKAIIDTLSMNAYVVAMNKKHKVSLVAYRESLMHMAMEK